MMKQVDQLKDTGHTIYLVSFADPIKKILCDSFGLTKAGKDPEFEITLLSRNFVKLQVVEPLINLAFEINPFGNLGKISQEVTEIYNKHEDEFYAYVFGAIAGFDLERPSIGVDYNYAFRRLGQMLGTELGRAVKDTIWIDLAINRVKTVFESDLADYAFIADCRFMNEYYAVNDFKYNTKYDSKVYGVQATDETRSLRRKLSLEELKRQDQHGSEVEVDSIIALLPEDYVIDNNSKGE